MPKLNERSTPDLIVIWLAGIVGLVVFGTLLISVFILVRNPDANIDDELGFVADMTASLMTGVIGYIGGRASAKNGNGDHKPPDEKGSIDPAGLILLLLLAIAVALILIRAL